MKRIFQVRHNWVLRHLIAIVVFVGSFAVGASAQAADPLLLTYQGKSVDSAPYYYAFPYRIERANIEHRKIYFSRHVEGEGKYLFVTEWDPSKPISLDSETATKVTDIDLNTINFWGRAFNTRLNGLIVEADDDKAEKINLWFFPEGGNASQQLTDVDYVYDFTQSKDHRAIYYTARYGASDAAKGCLEELLIYEDGGTGTRQLICDDNAAMPAQISSWNALRADSKRIIFTALKEGDRNKQELYAYDLSDGSVSLLFKSRSKSWLRVWNDWGDETQVLFASDRDLYRYDFETRKATFLKTFNKPIADYAPVGEGDTPAILVATETPFETKLEMLVIEPTSTKVLTEVNIPESVWLADSYNDILFIGRFSPETYASFELVTVFADGTFNRREAIDGLAAINEQLNRCNVERVQITYEDTSKISPGTVKLDTFIYRPKVLPPLEDQKFVITAYYGGKNRFSSYNHLWCALGISTVSPTVRGDGRYATNGNDREKADAPIRDTLAVARYLIKRFNVPSSRQIGTTGYSHGGWAAVRALSYPGPEQMDLGFAIAGGGFYDLPSVVDPNKTGETNIHGWFDKEFGTMDQQELLSFLSPSNHIEKINAPVFLYHGERDSRISLNQAKAFATLLAQENKPYRLMVVPDQGHSIRGSEAWAKINQGVLDLISQTP